jgi:hypothetical protein
VSELEGWQPDPYQRFEQRYFVAGQPTAQVRSGGIESTDPNRPAPPPYFGPPSPSGYGGGYPQSNQPGIGVPPNMGGYPIGPGYPGSAGGPYPPGAYSMGAAPVPSAAPPPKRRTGLWIGIVVAVVVIGLAIGIPLALTGSDNKKDAGPTPTSTANSSSSAASATTTGSSSDSPSPTSTDSGSPLPSGSDTATSGIVFSSPAGHFRARFPSQPTEQTVPESSGGVNITVHNAVVQDPITEVSSEDSSVAVPEAGFQLTMRTALTSFGSGAGLTDNGDQAVTTFRGRPARTASFDTTGGQTLRALVFFYTSSRLYYLVAEDGAAFDALSDSFVAIA